MKRLFMLLAIVVSVGLVGVSSAKAADHHGRAYRGHGGSAQSYYQGRTRGHATRTPHRSGTDGYDYAHRYRQPSNAHQYSGYGYSGYGYPRYGNAGHGYSGYGNAGYGNAGHGYSGHGYSGHGYAGYGNAGYGNAGYGNAGHGGVRISTPYFGLQIGH